MVIITRDMIKQFQILMEACDERLKIAFENSHQGCPTETLTKFLNAKDGNISEAHRMLVDSLNCRIENEGDGILSKPIISEMPVRDSQLEGMLGYAKNGPGQPDIDVGLGLSIYEKASVPTVESVVREADSNFNFGKESGLLQFLANTPSNSEDIGCNLMLTDQTLMSTRDERLGEYRRRCLENRYRFVRSWTRVRNLLAGRAAQTGIADHRTIHHELNQEDQHSADVGGKGQLVVPVFYDQGAGNKIAGNIEYVTSAPKESYVEFFDQIHHLLKVPTVESIVREVFSKYHFRNESGLLQFWACSTPDAEDIGCNLILTDQTYILTQDHEGLLQDYRRRCLGNHYPFVGLETSVGNWLAGRAAQTRIADQRTIHHVLNQEDQHSADVGGKGQLVLPVFYGQGAANKLVGIIEFVTPVPRKSYVEDFEQIHNLLKDEGYRSNCMGKTIRVRYANDMIKFTLPLSAKFADLRREVKMRFLELEHQNFCVEYDDIKGNCLPISSDEDLQVCMAESSSKGAKFIRMRVLLNT